MKKEKPKLESKLKKFGLPASYIGFTVIIISIIASELGVCD